MPDWSREIRERLQGVSLDPEREASIVEEIAQHLEDRRAELTARGVPPEEARKSALDELDSPAFASLLAAALPRPAPPRTPPAEDGGGWLSGLARDLRYGVRRLRFEPLFALVAPAMLVPTLLGSWVYTGISDATFRKVVLSLLTLSGIALVASGLRG